MASTDDLSVLAPSIRRQALGSAGDTAKLREYLQGAARGPAPPLPDPPRLGQAFLERSCKLRAGWRPQHRDFHGVRLRPVVQHSAEYAGDEEQLKNVLLEAYLRRSGEALRARLRTGWQRAGRRFGIKLKAVVLRVAPAPEEEEAALGSPIEAGVLAQEQEPCTAPRPAALAAQQQLAKTPGTVLGRTPIEGVPEWLGPTPAARRRAAATPGTALGRTPMEGVPERLGRTPAPVRRRAATPLTALGRTPVEGLERPSPPGQQLAAVRTRCLRGEAQPSVDSPIEGVVQQAAGPPAARLAAAGGAGGDFTFASPLGSAAAPAAGSSEHGAAQPAAEGSDNELDDGGFDYGGNDEPTAIKRPASSTEATPLHVPRTDAAVQTGISLRSRATPASHLRPARLAEQAVQTGASLQERPQEEAAGAEEGADLDYGDYDAGGFDDYDDYDEQADEAAEAADHGAAPQEEHAGDALDPPGAAAHGSKQSQRRQTLNPGARLRNELGKRKSLGTTPRAGRREVAPGVRRSTRRHEPPLNWWLGERKEYKREAYRTMPTVKDEVRKTPSTPWRTQPDIYRERHRKRSRQQQQGQQEQGGRRRRGQAADEDEQEEEMEVDA